VGVSPIIFPSKLQDVQRLTKNSVWNTVFGAQGLNGYPLEVRYHFLYCS
jgi:hypothetical protein